MTNRTPLVVIVLAAHGLGACLDVAEERARRDERVGQAAAEGHTLDVADGLAAVRVFERGRVELWANAPALDVTLEVGSSTPRTWLVTVRNTLPDAVLDARAESGALSVITPQTAEVSTERRIALEVEPGSRIRLSLAAPDAGAVEPFDFIEFADVQDAIDDVEDVFERMNDFPSARFAMMAGDITERGTADQLERFQREQRALRIPVFVTLGNHELGTGSVPYHDYFGRGSQSFVFHGARFTTLDSASATVDPIVMDWLDGWLAQGAGRAHLVFMHVPPLEPFGVRNGAFASRAEANRLLARLGRGGVTATFYGHVHSYYAYENAGMPAFISGGGGAIPERFDGVGRHFLFVRVEPATRRIDSRLVRVD